MPDVMNGMSLERARLCPSRPDFPARDEEAGDDIIGTQELSRVATTTRRAASTRRIASARER